MKRPKTRRKPVFDPWYPEITPEQKKKLSALAPDFTEMELRRLDWEIEQIVELLLEIYRSRKEQEEK